MRKSFPRADMSRTFNISLDLLSFPVLTGPIVPSCGLQWSMQQYGGTGYDFFKHKSSSAAKNSRKINTPSKFVSFCARVYATPLQVAFKLHWNSSKHWKQMKSVKLWHYFKDFFWIYLSDSLVGNSPRLFAGKPSHIDSYTYLLPLWPFSDFIDFTYNQKMSFSLWIKITKSKLTIFFFLQFNP